MANDIQDRIGQVLGSDSARALAGTAVTEALKAFGSQRSSNGAGRGGSSSRGGLSGARGLAAGAGAAAVAPIAVKGISKLIKGNGASALAGGPKKLAEEATSKLGDSVEAKLKDKVEDAGGPSGILKDTVKGMLPFGGGSGKQNTEGVGKGRRMPIQQSIDIGLPVETVYNQWTQFEEWPKFMHRVTRASQEDPCKASFTVKIWGKSKEFAAEIETQRPDDRIKWKTTQGMNHTGVVTFRELGPNLTRLMLSFDVSPGGMLEKYARGARYIKRAARADLHRFAAFIEMLEHETGAWRGVIEDGELVEDHDPSYDEQREYGSSDELVHGRGSEEGEDSEEEDSEEEDSEADEDSRENGGEPRQRQGRRSQSRAQSRSSGSSRTPSSRSSGGGSRGRGSSGGGSSGSRASSSRGSSSRASSARASSARASSARGSSSSGSSSSGSSARGSSSRGSVTNGSSSGSTRGRGSSAPGSSRGSAGGASSRSSSGSQGRGSTSRRSSGSSGASRSSGRSNGSERSSGGSSSSGASRRAGRTRSQGTSRNSTPEHQGRERARSSRRG
jgi:uncharacterized membrane protein